MKPKNKCKITLFIPLILFLALHYFGYKTEVLNGVPVITSPEPMPIETNYTELRLAKELLPDYLHPFQMLERHYEEKASGEIVVIEKGQLIRSEMNFVMGDPIRYFSDDRPADMFMRGFAVDDYPNGIFFLIQYIIAITFVFLLAIEILKYKGKD